MLFDKTKLFVAGTTDTTEFDAPDLVYVYFTDSPDEVTATFFKGASLSEGDVIIAGSKDKDGKVNLEDSCIYEAQGSSDINVYPSNIRFFKWISELDEYKPLSEAHEYWEDEDKKWQERIPYTPHNNINKNKPKI